MDLLLSHEGILGTLSSQNGDTSLPNCGYQQDGQPKLYFSNPDLWWAAKYHLPRLGQGGFREALEGLWDATTQEASKVGQGKNIPLQKEVIGKPYQYTYAFAEGRLVKHREAMVRGETFPPVETKPGEVPPAPAPLKRIYMVGDNPESDIRGGNNYKSPQMTEWQTILVETGIHTKGSEPRWKPNHIVGDVYDAVTWALKSSGWKV
jgi:ribonucleotide monophosphatase NagD (HAD superfamily)